MEVWNILPLKGEKIQGWMFPAVIAWNYLTLTMYALPYAFHCMIMVQNAKFDTDFVSECLITMSISSRVVLLWSRRTLGFSNDFFFKIREDGQYRAILYNFFFKVLVIGCNFIPLCYKFDKILADLVSRG